MALVESVKYALSSSPINQSAKKPVIFVKLTDSALRAIEDYLRLQQKTGQHATIQFLGNEGRIHIPSSHTPDGNHSFDFSLSPNTDIEGPQGSFECIQQCGPGSLQSMGTLPFKMRIHAKDDVYTTTRERFRFNEDKRKQESAKEIEQPSVENGPRVKKRFIGGSQRIQRGKAPSPSHNNYSQSKPSLIGGNSNSNSYSSHGNGYHQPRSNGINTHAKGIMSRSSYVPNPDITRRPLRERLIHMLAVKPLKKPEVMDRIYKQGLKEKDKKMLMMVLQQVSQLKDNVYNLSRGIWNDVQEDWPFYTEEERQIMKRRKPQNLTPPGSDSSVGSGSSGSSSSPRSTTSGSGNSPTPYTRSAPCDYPSNNSSHHNQYSSYGAPAKSNSNYSSVSNNGPSLPGQMTMQLPGTKRGPNFFDSNNNDDAIAEDGGPLDNIPTKKQRVSFFKKPNCSNKDSSSSSSNSANNVRSESRESPNPNKELPSHVQGSSSYAPHTQHQRVDKSLLHPSVMINNIPERLSPSAAGIEASNHKSPRNLKDHHSPTYNSLSNNQNNKSNHHGSNHMNSGQGNHHGEDFVYSSPAINNSVSGNDSWPSNGFGHQGNQLHHPRNNISSVSVNLDNDFELNMKLPDTNESDPITDCGQSAGSFNASVNHNHNHGSQSQHSANVNVSQVFSSSSSSSSLPSYGSSINYSSSSKDVSAISVTKRDHDGQGSGGPSLLSGGSRVSSSTAAVPKNAAPKEFLHSSESNLSNQVDMLHHLNGTSALRSDSGRDKEDRSSSVEVNEIGKKTGDRMQFSGSLKNRPADDHHRSSSRDRPKERSHGDRLKDRTKERDLDKASKFDKSSYLANYTTIRTTEQRNRYKADFSAEYDEYRNLHSVIDKVSKKFAHLAERLRKEEKGSTGYQMIRDEIIREYHYNKNSKHYTDARAKYAYLHDKLSHIKQLVSDYDALHSTDSVSTLADEDADY